MSHPLSSSSSLRERITAHLRGFELHTVGDHAQHAAAVAVAVSEEGFGANLVGLPRFDQWSERPALVLTRRAAHLRNHAGQWALPGGRIDAGETPEQAALRELAEEVGLRLDAAAVLGRLDDYVTRSG